MSSIFSRAAGPLALCLLAVAGGSAAAPPSSAAGQSPAPGGPAGAQAPDVAGSPTSSPIPRAFAGYAQPAIPPSACRSVSAEETRCSLPAMTAGRYLIEASGTSTAQSAGALQQMEIVVGDQLCGVGRDTAAWSAGARTFRFDCLATILTDKPLEVRAIYLPVKAAKDPKGPVLAVRPLGWNGVLTTLPFAPSQ